MSKYFEPNEDAAITTIPGIITNDFSAAKTCKLPRAMNPSKEIFESIGFTFEEIDDEFFFQGTLPEGWTLEKPNFYYAHIIDENGKRRGNIFYKGSFYDNCVEMKLFRKYNVSWKYIEYSSAGLLMEIFVEDIEHNVLTVIGTCMDTDWQEQDKLFKKGENYLNKHYPDWKDCSKYWD